MKCAGSHGEIVIVSPKCNREVRRIMPIRGSCGMRAGRQAHAVNPAVSRPDQIFGPSLRSAITASTSISTSYSGFTKRVTAMIVSTGRESRQKSLRASMASFRLSMSVRITRVRTMS